MVHSLMSSMEYPENLYFCELAFSRLRGFNILFVEEKYVNMCQLHIHIEKLRPMLITFSFSNYVFFSDL